MENIPANERQLDESWEMVLEEAEVHVPSDESQACTTDGFQKDAKRRRHIWNSESEAELIDLIYAHEELWLPWNSLQYKNSDCKQMKAKALQEVTHALNAKFEFFDGFLTPKLVDSKWASLRTYKCREMEKMANSSRPCKQWIHSTQMNFLKGLYKFNDTDSKDGIIGNSNSELDQQAVHSVENNGIEEFMPWNDETESLLIELVKQYPELWNDKHPSFKRKKLKTLAISRITNSLNSTCSHLEKHPLSIEDVQEKWATLRYTTHQIGQKIRSGNYLKYQNRRVWVHFERLKFILPENRVDPVESEKLHSIQLGSSTSSRKWTDQMEDCLIEAVKRFPELWDPMVTVYKRSMLILVYDRLTDYLNSTVEIFKNYPISVEAVEKRWQNLRSYRLQLEKCESKPYQVWKNFHKLSFVVTGRFDVEPVADDRRQRWPRDLLGCEKQIPIQPVLDPQNIKYQPFVLIKRIENFKASASLGYDSHKGINGIKCGETEENDDLLEKCDNICNEPDDTDIKEEEDQIDLSWSENAEKICEVTVHNSSYKVHRDASFYEDPFSVKNIESTQSNSKEDAETVTCRELRDTGMETPSTKSRSSSFSYQEDYFDDSHETEFKTDDLLTVENYPKQTINLHSEAEREFMPTTSTVETPVRKWSRKKNIYLIEFVEDCPHLWTPSALTDIDKDKMKRQACLTYVANHLNKTVFKGNHVTIQEVLAHWLELLNYKRHLRKLELKGIKPKRTWQYSHHLNFAFLNPTEVEMISCSSKKTGLSTEETKNFDRHWTSSQLFFMIEMVKYHLELWFSEFIKNRRVCLERITKHLNLNVPSFRKNLLVPMEVKTKFEALCDYRLNLHKRESEGQAVEDWLYSKKLDFVLNFQNSRFWTRKQTFALINAVKMHLDQWNGSRRPSWIATYRPITKHLNSLPEFWQRPVEENDVKRKLKQLRRFKMRTLKYPSLDLSRFEYSEYMQSVDFFFKKEQSNEDGKAADKNNHNRFSDAEESISNGDRQDNMSHDDLNVFNDTTNTIIRPDCDTTLPSHCNVTDAVTMTTEDSLSGHDGMARNACIIDYRTPSKDGGFNSNDEFANEDIVASADNALEITIKEGISESSRSGPSSSVHQKRPHEEDTVSIKKMKYPAARRTSSTEVIVLDEDHPSPHLENKEKRDINLVKTQMSSQAERSVVSIRALRVDRAASSTAQQEGRGNEAVSADLLSMVVQQIRYAFMMKKSSTQQQISLYLSISQVCTQFLGEH